MNEELSALERRIEQLFTAMEQRLDQRMDERLEALEQRLEGKLDANVEALKDFVRAQNEELGTRMLRAFYKWARPVELRMQRVEASDAAATVRISALEERMLDVEERLSKLPKS